MEQEKNGNPSIEVDFEKYPNAQKLLKRCQGFFDEVENLTPGAALESHLNTHYGPTNPIYQDLCRLTLQGLQEGWVANIPISGPQYRRSKISLPRPETRFFSITTVYMNSHNSDTDKDATGDASGEEEELLGQYHSHPYGEINCVIQIDEGAELRGMQGWQGAGWTSPGAGTHHYPQVRGGALISLFFLPAGRISYGAKPEDAQPVSV